MAQTINRASPDDALHRRENHEATAELASDGVEIGKRDFLGVA